MSKLNGKERIIIIGAGPTGLGAAYQLSTLGYENWSIYEREESVGGLSSSFMDSQGFVWDLGCHVMYSNIAKFNDIVNTLMAEDFITHDRESYIRMAECWVPYPFQNNIRHLPRKMLLDCLLGLIRTEDTKNISHFEDWVVATFGDGIAAYFMLPYNYKVWAFPATKMSHTWIAQRVSVVNIERILTNVIMGLDDTGWGPNNQFRFPVQGGTGGFFKRFEPYIQKNLYLRHKLVCVDIDSRTVTFENGHEERYDYLLNTAPLDLFVSLLKSRSESLDQLRDYAARLVYNGVHVVGIGLQKHIEGSKSWVYFPEEHIPFYRMTYFSHFSPNNVPLGDTYNFGSLLCETSFSRHKPVSEGLVVSETINGLIKSGILNENDRDRIISTWHYRIDRAYPVPTIDRDSSLQGLQMILERNHIYSRGRFGAWKYEIGNMDHSVMMGIELINRVLYNLREKIWTL